MAQAIPGIFARKATGLVREGNSSSVLIYNINFVSIGLMLVFALLMIPAFYPGANVQGTFIGAFIVVIPTSLTFALLARPCRDPAATTCTSAASWARSGA